MRFPSHAACALHRCRARTWREGRKFFACVIPRGPPQGASESWDGPQVPPFLRSKYVINSGHGSWKTSDSSKWSSFNMILTRIKLLEVALRIARISNRSNAIKLPTPCFTRSVQRRESYGDARRLDMCAHTKQCVWRMVKNQCVLVHRMMFPGRNNREQDGNLNNLDPPARFTNKGRRKDIRFFWVPGITIAHVPSKRAARNYWSEVWGLIKGKNI